jgi:hypothetical protein
MVFARLSYILNPVTAPTDAASEDIVSTHPAIRSFVPRQPGDAHGAAAQGSARAQAMAGMLAKSEAKSAH